MARAPDRPGGRSGVPQHPVATVRRIRRIRRGERTGISRCERYSPSKPDPIASSRSVIAPSPMTATSAIQSSLLYPLRHVEGTLRAHSRDFRCGFMGEFVVPLNFAIHDPIAARLSSAPNSDLEGGTSERVGLAKHGNWRAGIDYLTLVSAPAIREPTAALSFAIGLAVLAVARGGAPPGPRRRGAARRRPGAGMRPRLRSGVPSR